MQFWKWFPVHLPSEDYLIRSAWLMDDRGMLRTSSPLLALTFLRLRKSVRV